MYVTMQQTVGLPSNRHVQTPYPSSSHSNNNNNAGDHGKERMTRAKPADYVLASPPISS